MTQAASDVIVTKAGPGTIAEALISGLPILLNGNVPCQVHEREVDFNPLPVAQHRCEPARSLLHPDLSPSNLVRRPPPTAA